MNLTKKHRALTLLFLITSVNLISLSALTLAESTYSLNVEEGDRFIYQLKSWNEDLAEEYLGTNDTACILGSGAEVGSYYAWEISDLDEVDDLYSIKRLGNVDGWEALINVWYWTDDQSDFDQEEDDDKTLALFKEADDYGFLDTKPFESEFIPQPVEDYLKDCDWDSHPQYNQSGYKVSKAMEEVSDKFSFETREWRYDGVLKSIITTTEDGEEIYRIEMVESIIEIILGILMTLIIAVITLLGLGILFKKNRKIRDCPEGNCDV